MPKKVFLGMSGGVDSSVSATLLLEQGYDVTGIYMKNWAEDLPGMKCPWAEDLADAKRVAVRLGIDFEVWDFREQYREKVVEYMLREFEQGRTPNPDIMCNQEIKFKVFYERALQNGADYIATGHYARTGNRTDGATDLLRAVDENKDQTYFLYRMSDAATERAIFPVGGMTKPEVKALAAKHGLDVASKKESMGVCFVGEVGMKDFLQTYLDAKPGEIRETESEKVLGYHDGAIFYTLGQRHGLYIGGGLPYYVVKKDILKNIVYVSSNLNHPALWTKELMLHGIHLRGGRKIADLEEIGNFGRPEEAKKRNQDQNSTLNPQNSSCLLENGVTVAMPDIGQQIHHQRNYDSKNQDYHRDMQANLDQGEKQTCQTIDYSHPVIISQSADATQAKALFVRLRHRAPLIPARLVGEKLIFEQEIKRPAAGQSAVFYEEETCLGGGIVV